MDPGPPNPPPRTDLSRDGLRTAIDSDNIATRLYNADVPVEAHEDGDAAWAVAPLGDPYRSVVTWASFAPDEADARIDQLIAAYDARPSAFLWWRAPFHAPADLGARLQQHGVVPVSPTAAMAMDLALLPDRMHLPPGFEIEPVTTVDALREYVAILGHERPRGGPPLPPSVTALMLEHTAARFAFEPIPMRRLGRLHGRPVAISRLSLAGGAAGIYAVVTLPEARGRGIGTAMTLAPLLEARAAGYGIGTLQSTAMGYPIYRRLSFEEIFRYTIHVHLPPGAGPLPEIEPERFPDS